MAKKEGSESGDGYEFSVPDFDEDGFIHKEMVSFRTTSILFLVGLVSGLVSWGIYEAFGGAKMAWFIGLVIMAVAAYLLRYIYPALKVDIRHFGRREWFGTFFLMFFAWLAFFILFINPPISDHADPTADVFVSPSVQMPGEDITVDLFVADNFRLTEHSLAIGETGAIAIDVTDALVANADVPGHYTYTISNAAAGTYEVIGTALDSKENGAITVTPFVVGADAIDVTLPSGDLSGTASILVQLGQGSPCTEAEYILGGDCVRVVRLALADGTTIAMEYNDDFGGWIATSNYAGWSTGRNTFDVEVVQQDRFQGVHRIPGGVAISGPFSVDVPSGGGEKVVTVVPAPAESPALRRTPGFEAISLIAVLGAGAFIARRRQE